MAGRHPTAIEAGLTEELVAEIGSDTPTLMTPAEVVAVRFALKFSTTISPSTPRTRLRCVSTSPPSRSRRSDCSASCVWSADSRFSLDSRSRPARRKRVTPALVDPLDDECHVVRRSSADQRGDQSIGDILTVRGGRRGAWQGEGGPLRDSRCVVRRGRRCRGRGGRRGARRVALRPPRAVEGDGVASA